MATRETRAGRGRRRGRMLLARMLRELRDARMTAGVSQDQMGEVLGWSQARVWRTEADRADDTGVVALSEMASVLGYELSIGLHPIGDPIRDKGQQAVGARLEALLAPDWQVTNETLLPGNGELRAWDKLLRLKDVVPRHLVGVEIESRIHDAQELVRRTRLRERDGGVDVILLVLSDTATNRRLVGQLREALGADYAAPPRSILAVLRAGRPLPRSGVVLI